MVKYNYFQHLYYHIFFAGRFDFKHYDLVSDNYWQIYILILLKVIELEPKHVTLTVSVSIACKRSLSDQPPLDNTCFVLLIAVNALSFKTVNHISYE